MPRQSGRAEYGLLAALLVLVGSVGGVIWFVVKNHRERLPVAVDRPQKNRTIERPPLAPVKPPPPGLTKSRSSVTIVADPKTLAALDALRKSAVDDSKPLRITKRTEESAEQVKKPDFAGELQIDSKEINVESAEVRASIDLLKKYFAATSWKEKLPQVYQSAEVGPLMHEFYGSQGKADPVLTGLISASNVRVGDQKVLSLAFGCSDRLDMLVRANFHRCPEGLRLDWESFVGFSGKEMKEFRATRSTQPTVFRVLAVSDDYYNFEFAEAEKLLSVRLYNPAGDDYVHGYCARDSAEGRKLVQVLGDSSRSVPGTASGNGMSLESGGHFPITVEIAFPEKAQSDRCVRIDKFVSAWWLALDVEKQATAALKPVESPVSKTQ
ncbi:MAG: hypothetical protein K1X78_04495 [Verrucomicrobiaceae bacterium]|nr:hypothetical protein [Verrucomicrobiaceae bacterium]